MEIFPGLDDARKVAQLEGFEPWPRSGWFAALKFIKNRLTGAPEPCKQ